MIDNFAIIMSCLLLVYVLRKALKAHKKNNSKQQVK